ncbi:MAG: YmdB family metallophosphoesterase, partial [Solirubrobacterales bacterium]|nr:YmdB family metallophosphoesterase [Solirubrobacterales bacterium]
TGPRGGVIGVVKEQSIRGFVTHMNEHYDTADEDPWLMGVVVRCSAEPMRADAIEQLLVPAV